MTSLGGGGGGGGLAVEHDVTSRWGAGGGLSLGRRSARLQISWAGEEKLLGPVLPAQAAAEEPQHHRLHPAERHSGRCVFRGLADVLRALGDTSLAGRRASALLGL